MSEQTKTTESELSDVYETITASDIDIRTADGSSIRWLNGEGTEFECNPGTKFVISAYTQHMKSDEWNQRRKVISTEVARALIKSGSHFLIVKELMGSPDRLAVLFRSMMADGHAVKIGPSYFEDRTNATENRTNV